MPLENAKPCRWCQHIHGELCPHVKAFEFEYAEDGTERLKRVEFMTPNDHPRFDGKVTP